jgi:CelD/BcsL family acetyltransferase involved in cellulose biosynthesis
MARLEVFDAFAAARPLWRRLELALPLMTPYQRYEWLAHWHWHVGRMEGAEPLIVAGIDGDGVPMFILPFVRERRHGCYVATFGGGSESNLNMAIWRTDVAAAFDRVQLADLLRDIAQIGQIDLFALLGQPLVWRGLQNPFAVLPRQPSPDDVYAGALGPVPCRFEPQVPGSIRKKQRKLMRLDNYRFGAAKTAHDVERILGAFWPQRAARFAKMRVRNVFENPRVASFIRAACLDGLEEQRPALDLYALEAGGDMLAVVIGASDRNRFSAMFNSITAGPHGRLSPGIILFAEIATDCAMRGIDSIDLGAGQAPYKEYFCNRREYRFDCFVPVSMRGQLLAAALRTSGTVKHAVKTNPAAMIALQAVRYWTGGHAS